MSSWPLRPLTMGILLSSLWVGFAPAASQPLDVDTKMRAFTQRASQDELDAFARRKRMTPIERQSDDTSQSSQREQAAQAREAAIRAQTQQQEANGSASARAAIQMLREARPFLPPPPSRAETVSTVVTFCTAVGDTAALVAEARQKGMSAGTTLLFFRATAQEDAKPLVTHLVTKTLLLTDTSSPTHARDYVTAHCLDDPMFWTGPTLPLY